VSNRHVDVPKEVSSMAKKDDGKREIKKGKETER
jgi:hypothetical protein